MKKHIEFILMAISILAVGSMALNKYEEHLKATAALERLRMSHLDVNEIEEDVKLEVLDSETPRPAVQKPAKKAVITAVRREKQAHVTDKPIVKSEEKPAVVAKASVKKKITLEDAKKALENVRDGKETVRDLFDF